MKLKDVIKLILIHVLTFFLGSLLFILSFRT